MSLFFEQTPDADSLEQWCRDHGIEHFDVFSASLKKYNAFVGGISAVRLLLQGITSEKSESLPFVMDVYVFWSLQHMLLAEIMSFTAWTTAERTSPSLCTLKLGLSSLRLRGSSSHDPLEMLSSQPVAWRLVYDGTNLCSWGSGSVGDMALMRCKLSRNEELHVELASSLRDAYAMGFFCGHEDLEWLLDVLRRDDSGKVWNSQCPPELSVKLSDEAQVLGWLSCPEQGFFEVSPPSSPREMAQFRTCVIS